MKIEKIIDALALAGEGINIQGMEFKEVTQADCENRLTMNKEPFCVVKWDNRLYMAEIPYAENVDESKANPHKCADCQYVCKPECKKSWDKQNIWNASYIENGLETLNNKREQYVVCKCHNEKVYKRKMQGEKINKSRELLRALWEEGGNSIFNKSFN